jgi:hypothetical protein
MLQAIVFFLVVKLAPALLDNTHSSRKKLHVAKPFNRKFIMVNL